MCSLYVDSNGLPLNSVVCHPSSYIDDRDTSYGAANCHADSSNGYPVYVYSSATRTTSGERRARCKSAESGS